MTAAPNWKRTPWRSKRYLDYVRHLPCCLCRAPGPNDPHHYQRSGEGVMGGKVGDERVASLCHRHHMEVHQHGRSVFAKYGVDPEQVIASTQRQWAVKYGKGWEEL